MKWLSKVPWRPIFLLAGFAVLVILVLRLGPANLARQLLMVGPGFFWMLLAYAVGTIIQAFGFPLVLDKDLRPGPWQSISSRFSATSLNTVLPVAGIGGEPSRLLWLPPHHRRAGVAGLILDRTMLVIADTLFLLIAAIVALVSVALPARLAWIGSATVAVSIALAAAVYYVTSQRGVAVPAMRILGAAGLKAGKSLGDATLVDEAVRKMWQTDSIRAVMVLLLHLVGRTISSAEIWIGLVLFEVPITVPIALIVAALPLALSLLISIIPAQLGVQEAAQALTFSALGLNPLIGVSLVFLQRIRQLVFVPLGLILLWAAPHNFPPPPPLDKDQNQEHREEQEDQDQRQRQDENQK